MFSTLNAAARSCAKAEADDRQPTTDGHVNLEDDQTVADGQSSVVALSYLSELALIKQILRLGDVLAGCAAKLELHPLTFYARDLAAALNTFTSATARCWRLAAPG